ncbi:MAG: hypothetical protein WCL19_03120 [Verrucomicrobiota bacterium]|jgi:hypothetical protein
MKPQYLTDQNGKKISVVLPIEDYEELKKHVEGLRAIAERRQAEQLAFEEVKTQLIADQLLQE